MNSGANPQPDDDTVRRFLAGDKAAFETIREWLAPSLLSKLAFQLRKQQDAEDVSQMTWDTVWTSRKQFKGGNLRAWIFRIAESRKVDYCRVENRHARAKQFSEDFDPVQKDDSEDTNQHDERLAALRECLKSVGSIFVETLYKTQIEKRSRSELAAEQGVKIGTIYSQANRGHQELKQCIEKKLGKVNDQ